MEDKNIKVNLFVKQVNQSNALAHKPDYLAYAANYNFLLLDNAYENTGIQYAKIKLAIEKNTCIMPDCKYETNQLKRLQEAPQKSLSFLNNIADQLSVVENMFRISSF